MKPITPRIADLIRRRYSELLREQNRTPFSITWSLDTRHVGDIDDRANRFREYVWNTYGAAPFSVALIGFQMGRDQ